MSRERRLSPEDRGWRAGGRWWLVLLALAGWPWLSRAAPQPGQTEVLKRGAEPESLIRFQPIAGASQRLAWEWTAQGVSIASGAASPAGQPRSIRGFWDAGIVELQEEGFSSRRSLSVSSAEPADDTFDQGFSETVSKDLRGLTRSIETSGSPAKPFGVISPWTVHRALDIVFPAQPVGVDAQWKVVRSLELDDGLSVDVEAIYELKRVASDSVGIVYSLEVKRSPVPKKYARQAFKARNDPRFLATHSFFVSLTCTGRAVQYLDGDLPTEAELHCQVSRETKQGNTWLDSATGEQITARIGPVRE